MLIFILYYLLFILSRLRKLLSGIKLYIIRKVADHSRKQENSLTFRANAWPLVIVFRFRKNRFALLVIRDRDVKVDARSTLNSIYYRKTSKFWLIARPFFVFGSLCLV